MDGKRIKCLRFSSLFLLIFLLFDSYRNRSRDNARNEKKPIIEQSDTKTTGVENIQRIEFHEDNAMNESKHVFEQNDPIVSDIENIQRIRFQKRNLQDSSSKDELEEPENKEADMIKNKMFWSDHAESFVPKGLSFKESTELVKKIRGQVVKRLLRGNKKICGDGQNAIAGLEDGSVMCVRYVDHKYYIYAEVLAFYLSRLLNMDSIPEVVLAVVNSSSALWKRVDTDLLSWEDNEIVSMMRRIPDVSSYNYIPHIIKEAYLKGRTVTHSMFRSTNILNRADIADVIQWGTLIVFDNLIGHNDRLNYWIRPNHGGFTGKLHNSVKSSLGKIWLVDHERAFFYRGSSRDLTYNFLLLAKYHDKMLKTMCVFQSRLVKGLQALSTQPSPFETLWNYTRSYEPLLGTMPKEYKYETPAKLFNKRLEQIMEWIEYCKKV